MLQEWQLLFFFFTSKWNRLTLKRDRLINLNRIYFYKQPHFQNKKKQQTGMYLNRNLIQLNKQITVHTLLDNTNHVIEIQHHVHINE